MALSTQRAVSNGTLQVLILSIKYIERSDITVFLNSIETTAFTWVNDTSIRFNTVVPQGHEVLIRRATDMSKIRHQFTTGAQFKASTLDEDFTQILHISQEAMEGGTVRDLYNVLNMHGYKISNLGKATVDTDAISLGQVKLESKTAWVAAEQAKASETAANASKIDAADSAASALASKNAAGASASAAAGSAGSASNSATTARTQADRAAAAAAGAAASETASAEAAEAAAKSAAASTEAVEAVPIILAAKDAAAASAVDAEASAEASRAYAGSLLPPSPEAPTSRPGGGDLKPGDRYFNTTNFVEYIWTHDRWAANDSLAATEGIIEDLKSNAPLKGAATIGVFQSLSRPRSSAANLISTIRLNVEGAPWNAVGDAKYQDPVTRLWYSDAALTIEATDDYPAIQACLDYAAELGCTVAFPGRYFYCKTGSPVVSSRTTVIGAGMGSTAIIQPNYYKYDRPNVPYERDKVVDWNAFRMAVNTSHCHFEGMALYGPFYRQDGDYANHPVENWPASNGISHLGRDYQFRKSLPYEGEGFNITIERCHFEGWGEEATQLDYVTNFIWSNNVVRRCGRGGLRLLGSVHGHAESNDIRHLYPGDYLNGRIVNGTFIGGNRMYGIEATRTYVAGCRPSDDIWISYNYVEDCKMWKCYGTHGGTRIRFMYNTGVDGHHGIGIDKGGASEAQGFAPPLDITVVGNSLYRFAPGDEFEGNNEGGPGSGLFITAHDGLPENIGRGLYVAGNLLDGWGTDNLYGGFWLGNWTDVDIGTNRIRNSHGCAMRFRDILNNMSIGTQVVNGVKRSATGVQRGLSVESGAVDGMLAPCSFENTDPVNELNALYLSNNDGNTGLTIQAGHKYRGLIKQVNIGANAAGGPFQMMASAIGHVTVSGTNVTFRGVGIKSVVRQSLGVYVVTLLRPASSKSNMVITPSVVQLSRAIGFDIINEDSFRINVFNSSTGASIDNSFAITVNSY